MGAGFDIALARRKSAGRGRRKTVGAGDRGRFIRAAAPAPGERVRDPAVLASIQAAALRGAGRRPLEVLPRDIRKKIRLARGAGLILFLVDASDSMGASAQLEAAKGAVFALLRAAYIRRDRVGLIAFRGQEARVLLPPASSVHLARKKLEGLSSGGATPFADGLFKAWKLIRAEKLKNALLQTVLVIVSDGEANVALAPGGNMGGEIRALGQRIRAEGIRSVFVDTNPPGANKTEAASFARMLGAEYRRVSRPGSRELVQAVDPPYAG
ncbi:MAG: VWA domain-containing protein [Spirochaetia bacterium]|jgi:magnesium chelatase subunit D|nr:VWA domain-containing protein [Spirochaetia bacterium]